MSYDKYEKYGAYHWKSAHPTFFWRYSPIADANYRIALEYLTRSLKPTKDQPMRILDNACGDGVMVYRLAQQGFSVVGLDRERLALSLARREIAKRNVKAVALLQGTCEALPFQAGSFDGVVAMELIEHLDGPTTASFLSEIRRVLRSDGVLVITTPHKITEEMRSPYHIIGGLFPPRRGIWLFSSACDECICAAGTALEGGAGPTQVDLKGRSLQTVYGSDPGADCSLGTRNGSGSQWHPVRVPGWRCIYRLVRPKSSQSLAPGGELPDGRWCDLESLRWPSVVRRRPTRSAATVLSRWTARCNAELPHVQRRLRKTCIRNYLRAEWLEWLRVPIRGRAEPSFDLLCYEPGHCR
jgi:SAM-dependent methyltransferase